MTKICRKCGEEKSRDCFDNKLDAADRKHPYCKDCRRSLSGAKKRQPPKLVDVDTTLVEEIESKLQGESATTTLKQRLKERRQKEQEDATYAQIVAETLEYAKHPAMQKKRIVRNNAKKLQEQPVLNFEKERWSEQDENIADMLYEAWEKRQKQDQETYKKVNDMYPILTKRKDRDYSQREGLSYDIYAEWEEGMNFESNE